MIYTVHIGVHVLLVTGYVIGHNLCTSITVCLFIYNKELTNAIV